MVIQNRIPLVVEEDVVVGEEAGEEVCSLIVYMSSKGNSSFLDSISYNFIMLTC